MHPDWAGATVDLAAARARLIDDLRQDIKDQRVLKAMSRVPRERFLPAGQEGLAYQNKPLSIGLGQTISQPLMVGIMTEALELGGDEKVLEVGTGSGYQAAVLAELARWVVSVERLPELAEKARAVLESLGYGNIELHLAERRLGWPRGAPYDAIVVTAGAPEVPQDPMGQLRQGGRMVVPVGSRYEQTLVRVTKSQKRVSMEDLGPCRWVPLIGEGGWRDPEP